MINGRGYGITVSSGNPNYSSLDGVLFNKNQTTLIKYPEAKSGTSYTIPNSVTSIGWGAFYYCTGLTSITIPNSVTSIGESAFLNASLTSITIPNSVTSIGNNAFSCGYLTAITVSASNPNYSSLNGVLFNKNQTLLYTYPMGKSGTSYVIPNTVTSIGNNAFSGCTGLTSITIPNSVTSIGAYAFSGCSGLTSITIGSGANNLSGSTFSGADNLENICVSGDNPYYRDIDGVLYTKDGTTLVFMPPKNPAFS